MSFPACRHRKKSTPPPHGRWRWLAAEPYRLFFASGALWSVIGVALWPLYYSQQLGFYPGLAHARLMIEAFGGAFVAGFLGTAGPRMASAPRLTPWELVWLFVLHQACALAHLTLRMTWGDGFFVALLVSLLLCLVVRVLRFRQEAPPPQMLLALTGLVCGAVGAALHLLPSTFADLARLRLAGLLLYQGLLLPPVLGIGSFVFPRMLGGAFGDAENTPQCRAKLWRAVLAAAGLVASFFLETAGHVHAGYGVRAGIAVVYLLSEIRWNAARSGSLTTGLRWALALGLLGLGLAPFWYAQHVSIEHLLYIGGVGLLMLIVGSRVLFGHSGDLEGFFARGGWARWMVFLGVLAAITRATPAWRPSTTVSHHIYAAITWAFLALGWLWWHRRRFLTRDKE
ncbi:MAG: NnrS family protein [Prosthecobacter sp.]